MRRRVDPDWSFALGNQVQRARGDLGIMENRIRLQRFCTEAGAAFASMGCVCNIRCACIRKSILIPSAHGSLPIRTLLVILELNFPSSFVCSSPLLGFFSFIIPTHVAWLRCRLNEARLSLRQAHGSPSAVRSLDLKTWHVRRIPCFYF